MLTPRQEGRDSTLFAPCRHPLLINRSNRNTPSGGGEKNKLAFRFFGRLERLTTKNAKEMVDGAGLSRKRVQDVHGVIV